LISNQQRFCLNSYKDKVNQTQAQEKCKEKGGTLGRIYGIHEDAIMRAFQEHYSTSKITSIMTYSNCKFSFSN